MMLWHYTTGDKFKLIVKSGVIRPATGHVPHNEKPIVWFSTNQFWEETVNKGLALFDGTHQPLTMLETCKYGGGLVRIGVAPETAPHMVRRLKRLSGMTARTARGLYNAGIHVGASPSEWRGTFEPVSREMWLAIECFEKGGWVAFIGKGGARP